MKLINAIENVIDNLENNEMYYIWNQVESCNCGLLVRELGQLEGGYVRDCIQKTPLMTTTWMATSKYCQQTGFNLKEIFCHLFNAGLTLEDITNLEYLSDPKILAETDIDEASFVYYSYRSNLIKYLKGWLVLLKKNVMIVEQSVCEIERTPVLAT